MKTIIFALCFVALILTPVNAQVTTTPYGGVLKVGWITEPDTLNPFVTVTIQAFAIFSLTYDTLGKYDKEMNAVPWLASWDVSSDGGTWTFHLAKNATWSDGVPLTSADVKFTYDYAISNKIGTAASMVSGVESVETPDQYTAVVKRGAPLTAGFETTLTYPPFPVLPKHVWENVTGDQILKYDNLPVVGSGPFVLDEWKRGEYISLKANTNYWRGRPYLDGVLFKIYKSFDTMLSALKTGEIDVIPTDVPALTSTSLSSDPNIKVVTSPDYYTRVFTPNCNVNGTGNRALMDVRVRRAMNYAIDKNLLAQIVHLGLAEPAVSFIPPAYGMWFDPNLKPYPFNLTIAAQMLQDAGYTDPSHTGVRSNSQGLRLEFNYLVLNRWPEEMRAASQVQQWFSEIGIKLNVQAMDGDTITAYNYPVWKYDIYFWGWKVGPDIGKRLWVLTTDAVTAQWSASGWSDPTYDQLWNQQAHTMDPGQRKALIWKLQEYILDQSPEIPFYHMNSIAAYRLDTFTGYIPLTGGILSETNIWSWMSVRLITPQTVTATGTVQTTGAAGQADYTPWIVAAIAIVIAIAALGYSARRRQGKTD